MIRPLRIGIDARAAAEVPAGRGRLVRELLRAIAAGPASTGTEYVLYAREPWAGAPLDDRFTWALTEASDALWHARVGRAASRRCDVYLATNSYLSPVLTPRIPSVLVVYDLAALDPATSPNRRSAVTERLMLAPAVRRAARLICISQATADALLARHPEVASKVTVAPLAASPSPPPATGAETDPPEPGLPKPGFVLAVGTLEPRKNLPRLVAAYAALPTALQGAHPLVVVGATGWRTGETLEALRSLGDRCRMLGHVSDGTLAELYRRCAVFCYPSLNEGFGLPVLEAMAAGTPVLTSNVSSLPEVGGDAVAYADPLSVDALRTGLQSLLTDPARRAQLAAAGPVRAAGFSWESFAAAVTTALTDAGDGRRGAPRST